MFCKTLVEVNPFVAAFPKLMLLLTIQTFATSFFTLGVEFVKNAEIVSKSVDTKSQSILTEEIFCFMQTYLLPSSNGGISFEGEIIV